MERRRNVTKHSHPESLNERVFESVHDGGRPITSNALACSARTLVRALTLLTRETHKQPANARLALLRSHASI